MLVWSLLLNKDSFNASLIQKIQTMMLAKSIASVSNNSVKLVIAIFGSNPRLVLDF